MIYIILFFEFLLIGSFAIGGGLATIPFLINDLNEKQILKKGDKLLLIGFGVGYSWGTTIIEY